MIITTSQGIDGHTITAYLGVVSAALIMVLPGGNKAVGRGWQTGVNEATELLALDAESRGANAVIAARFEPIGSHICATGTAVRIE